MKAITKNTFIIGLILPFIFTIISCNSINSEKKDNIAIQKNIDLRKINPNVEHNEKIIQAAEEMSAISKEESIYTGFNSIDIDGYKIVYRPDKPDSLIIYYNGEVLTSLEGYSIDLYQKNSYIPYWDKKAVYYNSKDNEIRYNNDDMLFSDFGLDGIDGIYKIENRKTKEASALLGNTIIPKKLLYENKNCEIVRLDGFSCCIVGGEKKLMRLGIYGWEKIESSEKLTCN